MARHTAKARLVDTVNFQSLLEEHGDLDEIWISRIVDTKQIRKPHNLHDSLANLCQLFAASVGEDDVKLFKYHVKYDEPRKWKGTVVEIHVPAQINFKWNHSNLDHGRALGRAAAKEAIAAYEEAGRKSKEEIETVRFVNQSPAKEKKVRADREEHLRRREIDEDRLKRAIFIVKPDMDPALLSKKMRWQVDAEGNEVEPNDKGEYPKGSVPYPEFVLRIPEVRKAYDGLIPPPDLSKL